MIPTTSDIRHHTRKADPFAADAAPNFFEFAFTFNPLSNLLIQGGFWQRGV